jgi:hypothetical protein
MKVALVLAFFCLMLTVCPTLQQPNNVGIEKAVLTDICLQNNMLPDMANGHKTTVSPLQFRFSSPLYTYGWWCVLMFEDTQSWHDNYLCTDRDIGLHWIWDGRLCRTDLKCVSTAEPGDHRWHDNALCLPRTSPIELVWSYCGAVYGMNCIQLYDPAAPGYTHDNYLCWKEH